MKKIFLIVFSCALFGCNSSSKPAQENISDFITDSIPNGIPIPFLPELVADSLLIHRGIFNNYLDEYYFTVSDKMFSIFTVKVIKKENGTWTEPIDAFFNSQYSDHGMSFSPDGNTLVFSSTRPTNKQGIPDTWHIWQSIKKDGEWSEPEFIDIPNLQNQLTSHPTLTNEGTLYFHSSDLDYSEMAIFYSNKINGEYQDASKLIFENLSDVGYCTPYVSSTGQHLIFAKIGQHLDLYICKELGNNKWSDPEKLPSVINQNGQGNPYLTPDSKYLFFTTEGEDKWSVSWVDTQSFLAE